MSKDKEYIVDTKVDATLSEEEKQKLRKKTKPVGSTLAYGRQNVFTDRRDPQAIKQAPSPDRRKNKRDRRDKED